jgi:hypothetical protein
MIYKFRCKTDCLVHDIDFKKDKEYNVSIEGIWFNIFDEDGSLLLGIQEKVFDKVFYTFAEERERKINLIK